MKYFLVLFILASSWYVYSEPRDAFSIELEQVKSQFAQNEAKITLALLHKLEQKVKNGDQNLKLNIAFGEFYSLIQNIEQSNKYFNLALGLSKKESDKIDILYNLGRNAYNQSIYDKAIYYLTRLLHSNNIHSSIEIKAKAETLLGLTYCNVDNYELSKKFLLRCLKSYSKINDTLGLSQSYGNLGRLFSIYASPQRALFYFKKGIGFKINYKKNYLGSAYSNIGAMFVELKEADSAIFYISKSLKISKELNDREGERICFNNLATIYRNQGQTQQSLKYYLIALSKVDGENHKDTKRDILFNVSEAYERLGVYDKSLDYYQQYTDLKDSLFNQEKSDFIVLTREKFNTAEHKKQIAELKVKKQQYATEKLAMKYSLITGSVVVVLIFVLIFWFQRAKSLKEQNERNIAISTAALDSEEKERLRISQEIHDDLGGVLGLSRMLFSTTKKHLLERDPELYSRIDNLLLEANNRSRAISHELFSPTLKEFGIIKALEELFHNVKKANPDLMCSIETSGSDEKLDENTALNLYRIVQELINNTFKYAAASRIELNLIISGKNVKMTYADNGIGVDLNIGKHGVGLKSIQSRAKRINGDVLFVSTPGTGFKTSVELELS